ncbi:hypothetical protein EXIGLDRAFT_781790 [Exidia glandulosa HHB12029]|uniref:Uncharacterized protein n=1 Tax=Exidia glandulosa HHB12029 TaxID=1314781 RepID=A0A165B4W2_EXIGL|nr:hypothetical protein EXIGLDRAFT_781790 [Exidia glandulosa HHB12029]
MVSLRFITVLSAAVLGALATPTLDTRGGACRRWFPLETRADNCINHGASGPAVFNQWCKDNYGDKFACCNDFLPGRGE